MNREQALKKANDFPASEDCGARGIYYEDVDDLVNEIFADFNIRVDKLLSDIQYTQDKDLIVSKIKALKDNK